jgi:alkanesulfonate monooxygenase SsuD/methylene tetrahydromethanopterin reductase-like flavin-dependent oxidoreductase (luciferase family)
MATERARLGLMVGANTFRNPGLVAKQAVTLDHVSGGRAVLGIGGAWMEAEHVAHGIDFGTGFGQRLDWLDESVAAMRGLLDGRTITSPEGGHYRFRELRHSPLPVQPRLPILVGGTGRTKTLRTVARYADTWNCFGTVAQAAELDGVLRAHCAEVGRDEREIERQINLWVLIRDSEGAARRAWEETAIHNRCPIEGMVSESRPVLGPVGLVAERLRAYREAGFGSVLIEVPAPYDIETLERLIGEVKPLVDAG